MIRIGIIGSGFGVVGLKPAFESVKGCKVVGTCTDRDAWRVFLKSPDLDAVAIAVTPKAQYVIAKAALSRGLHVFAEKPLATNAGEAKELLSLAQKKKVVHGIDFMFPEIPAWKKIKKLLEMKAFGKLRHVSVRWKWLSGDIKHKRRTWKTDRAQGGGVLSFYFSHGLHYLEHFVGKIQNVQSTFRYSPESLNGAEVGMDLQLLFKNGVTADVQVACDSRERIIHQLTFQCERATIVLETKNAVVDNFSIRILGKRARQVYVKEEKSKKGEDERVKIVRKLAERFARACARGAHMTPSFVEGLRVQQLIEMARNSDKKSRKAVL